MTLSASLKQAAKASKSEAKRVKRCGCTTAITLPSVAARAALPKIAAAATARLFVDDRSLTKLGEWRSREDSNL